MQCDAAAYAAKTKTTARECTGTDTMQDLNQLKKKKEIGIVENKRQKILPKIWTSPVH